MCLLPRVLFKIMCVRTSPLGSTHCFIIFSQLTTGFLYMAHLFIQLSSASELLFKMPLHQNLPVENPALVHPSSFRFYIWERKYLYVHFKESTVTNVFLLLASKSTIKSDRHSWLKSVDGSSVSICSNF
jgi:hypothetical protein